jgi:Phage portal protein
MAWYNPFSWRQNVTYQNVQGKHTYTLNSPDYGRFISCFKGAYSDANVLMMFKLLPEVFAPIDGIAKRVCNGRFVVKRVSNDEIVYSKKNLNRLLENPNPLQKWNDFVYNAIVYKLCGNRYIYTNIPDTLSFDYNNISSVWALQPQYTDIHLKSIQPDIFNITSSSDLIDYYQVDYNGRPIKIDPRFVNHDSPLNIDVADNSNPLKGISPLVADEYPMANLCAVYEARNVIYVKRGPLGAMVSRKGDESGMIALKQGEKDQVIQDIQSAYGLSHGKSPLAIIGEPVDFLKYGADIKDLEPFQETMVSSYAIASTLSYPKELLPSEKQSTYENQKSAEIGLYQNVIIKEGKELASILTKAWGLLDQGLYIDVSYDHIEILQADKKLEADTFNTKSTAITNLYNQGFITKNQGLVMLGQEQVDGFGVYVFNDPNRQSQSQTNTNVTTNAPTN